MYWGGWKIEPTENNFQFEPLTIRNWGTALVAITTVMKSGTVYMIGMNGVSLHIIHSHSQGDSSPCGSIDGNNKPQDNSLKVRIKRYCFERAFCCQKSIHQMGLSW